jgi:hypothetical protein
MINQPTQILHIFPLWLLLGAWSLLFARATNDEGGMADDDSMEGGDVSMSVEEDDLWVSSIDFFISTEN